MINRDNSETLTQGSLTVEAHERSIEDHVTTLSFHMDAQLINIFTDIVQLAKFPSFQELLGREILLSCFTSKNTKFQGNYLE